MCPLAGSSNQKTLDLKMSGNLSQFCSFLPRVLRISKLLDWEARFGSVTIGFGTLNYAYQVISSSRDAF